LRTRQCGAAHEGFTRATAKATIIKEKLSGEEAGYRSRIVIIGRLGGDRHRESISLHEGELSGGERPPTLEIHDLRYSAIQMVQIEDRCRRNGRAATAWYAFAERAVEEKVAQTVVGRMLAMDRMAGDDTAICHPSDNLAAVLAAAEYADGDGADFLAALAVAYQVQARLSDEAPVRDRGFDHTTQGAYAVAAGVVRALRLDPERAANAIALSGVGNIALRVTRIGALSQWKGLAYPNAAFIGTHAAFLAMRGITGPLEVFEGNKGFKESVSGPYDIDWASEDLERVTRTIVKKYNAEIHAQSAIDAALELRRRHKLDGAMVARVEIDIFDVAYHIIGGGEEGDKTTVRTKEQADHSLQYMVAVALCDGELLPAQYAPSRIVAPDVQSLLRRVTVRPDAHFTARFPEAMACRVAITARDGSRVALERQDYEGFHTRPMSWEGVASKFHHLAAPFAPAGVERAIVDAVARLERLKVRDLTELLARLPRIDTPRKEPT
jgi:2-methylcitrate dehydratase